jgi:hypothetical protein
MTKAIICTAIMWLLLYGCFGPVIGWLTLYSVAALGLAAALVVLLMWALSPSTEGW